MAEESSFSPNVQTAPGAGQTARPSLRELTEKADEEKQNGVESRKEAEKGKRTQGREGDQVAITEEARKASQAAEADTQDRRIESRAQERRTERGAAQVLEDLEQDNARGVRGTENSAAEAKVETRSGKDPESIRSLGDTAGAAARFGKKDSGLDSDRNLVQESKERVLPAKIEQKNVVAAIDDDREQRQKAEAAKEPLFVTPEQNIQASEESDNTRSSGGAEEASAREDDVSKSKDEERQQQQQADPASVETEIGQNVDRLI